MENQQPNTQVKKEKMHPLLIVIMVVMLIALAFFVFGVIKVIFIGENTSNLSPKPPATDVNK